MLEAHGMEIALRRLPGTAQLRTLGTLDTGSSPGCTKNELHDPLTTVRPISHIRSLENIFLLLKVNSYPMIGSNQLGK